LSTDQIVLLAIGLIVIAAVAVTVAYATAHASRDERRPSVPDPASTGMRDHDDGAGDPTTTPATGGMRTSTSFVSPASTRQVARVVAFLFLASVAVVVALTNAWPESQAAIFTLLAAGMLLVVLFMDMVPPAALGRWRRPVEGIGAVVFLGLLMAFTGGAASPFLVGFFLVVAGTALSTEGRAPLAVALVGAATIGLVGLVDAIDGPIEPEALATIGIAAVSLILLADIATAAARAQRQARDEALRASRFDALTGLYNRSFFFTTMEQEIRRSDRMGRGFTMLMLDLDDLKPVNDTFGHQWGDRLLKAIADTIRETIRFTDAGARYGGDEFVVLLPETDATGGYVVGEKLRRDIAALTLHAADRNVRSSVSVGLVTYPDDGTTIEQLVAAADVAMYESKRRGKNRIVGYQTRTERVATAIDGSDAAELVQLTPAADVRTGGDPAPWGTTSSGGRGRPTYGDYPVAETRLPPPAQPRDDRSTIPVEPDRSTIPVEPDDPGPAPWSTETGSGFSPIPRRSPPPDPDRSPSDGPPPRALDSLEPPGGSKGRTTPEVGLAQEQPWLTRTDSSAPRPLPPAVDAPRSTGASPPKPEAEPRSGERKGSRSDEIRSSGERPWIALPIEPYDPDEEPPDDPGS
jgi:diguanylate cyclase (GGDEF)-like protein